MAKLTLTTVTGEGAITLNANFAAIVTAMEKTLSRDGTTPNTMSNSLDMNSESIINLPTPTSNSHAATKKYVDDEILNLSNSIIGDVGLSSIAVVTATDGQFLVGDGTKWVGESGATVRTSLGLAIGTDVQAYDAVLAATTASFTSALETKLSGIETGATADQTGPEIKALYEAEANSFTDAQFTKLSGIETSATADQTGAEIKTLYEAEANSFTDAQFTKLSGIEAGATADQTGAEIKALYEAESNTNAFTDAQVTKLSGIETSADVTDSTNVTAAGAAMTTGADFTGDLSTTGDLSVGTTIVRNALTAIGGTGSLPTLGTHNGGLTVGYSANWGLDMGALTSGRSFIQSHRADGTGTAYDMLLQPLGGNVGIGTTSPGSKLSVSGTVNFSGLPTSSVGLSSGDLWNDSGTLKVA